MRVRMVMSMIMTVIMVVRMIVIVVVPVAGADAFYVMVMALLR